MLPAIFVDQTWTIAVLKQSYKVSTTVNILKTNFHYYRPNVFSKLFRMVKGFMVCDTKEVLYKFLFKPP